MPGPFKLPSAENDLNEKTKRAAIAQVKKWAESYIPAEVLQNHDCIVDVSEIQCGDPNCAPIDTVVRLLFKGNVGCVVVVIFCVSTCCFFWNWNLPFLSLSTSLFLSWVVLLLTLSGSFPAREKDLASFFPLLAMFLPIGFHRNSLDFTADLQNTSFFP